jgi:putative transposase
MTGGKKHQAEQVVNLLRQIEVGANGKSTYQAAGEAGIVKQT